VINAIFKVDLFIISIITFISDVEGGVTGSSTEEVVYLNIVPSFMELYEPLSSSSSVGTPVINDDVSVNEKF